MATATPPLSTLLLTAEEHDILTRSQASLTGKIDKCFNVSFSSSERERCHGHRAAAAAFGPCSPDEISPCDFDAIEGELNRTKV